MSEAFLLETAIAAVRLGATPLMAGFGRPIAFREKSSRNFVTPLDAQAEALILEKLRQAFPEHGVLAEEAGDLPGRSGFRWIVDPLSSTRNYIHGMPHWAVCLALEREGVPLLAVVLDPFSDELFTASFGKGCYRNGERQSVSEIPSLDQAMVCATFDVEGEVAEDTISQGLGYYARLARHADLRSLGSAGLHLAYVGSGRLDAFVTNDADPFAAVAGALLVREAGGVVTDFRGNEWTASSRELIASNGRFHDRLLHVVQGA